MATQQQIDANRQNAQKSTGPKTPEGKAAISQNALTHGLTAENACINGEDKDEFDASLQSFQDEFKPVGPLQTLLVEQIAMAAWRLSRIRTLETGLFQLRLADDAKDIERGYQNVSQRARLAYVFRSDIRGNNTLTILGRYEARVERSFYRALRELKRLQKETAKQSQIAPEPQPQQDVTPPSNPSLVPLCLCGEPSPPDPCRAGCAAEALGEGRMRVLAVPRAAGVY